MFFLGHEFKKNQYLNKNCTENTKKEKMAFT